MTVAPRTYGITECKKKDLLSRSVEHHMLTPDIDNSNETCKCLANFLAAVKVECTEMKKGGRAASQSPQVEKRPLSWELR